MTTAVITRNVKHALVEVSPTKLVAFWRRATDTGRGPVGELGGEVTTGPSNARARVARTTRWSATS